MLQSPYLLLLIEVLSCTIKIYLLIFLTATAVKSAKIQKQLLLLLTVLTCSLIVDFSWVAGLFLATHLFGIDYKTALFIIRIAWAINYILFLALGFFIESLCEKNYIFKFRQKFFIYLGTPWISYFVYIAFMHFNTVDPKERILEQTIIRTGALIAPFLLVLPSLYFTIRIIKKNTFPKILKKQISILVKYLIFPYLITQFMDYFSIYYKQLYLIIGLSNSFLAWAIYFSISKIMKLRFLNFSKNIQSPQKFKFIDHFKNFLASITQAKSLNEINYIIKTFFRESLSIDPNRVAIYYRQIAFESSHLTRREPQILSQEEAAVERLINNGLKHEKLLEYMRMQQILLYDEIEFTNFYQKEALHKEILDFMNEIRADVFLPIYEQNNLIAYIIIASSSRRAQELFSNLEHDQMLIMGSYLGHIITLLQLNNYKDLLSQNKILQERLYQTNHENSQFKESIQSFLRDNKQRQTGILFYKSHHFTFGNQASKELIPININMLDGHPLTKSIKRIVKQAEEFKTSQSTTAQDAKGNSLIITALPHLEKNNTIITVAYPEISDVLKLQSHILRNPSEWEYLLYLQTTQSGKLINRLIPGSSVPLLNFKIELLKAALSKKAVLLDLPEDDLEPTAEILHHISLREKMHKLTMNSHEKNGAIAIKLFGVSPLFGNFDQALLEQLNPSGTLFIQNVHLLEMSTQEALAEFFKYGYYTVCKSNKRVSADVRVIFSTSQNLETLVNEEKFSKALYDELHKTVVMMPSLFNLTQEELDELIKEFSQQEMSNANDFQNLLEFTSRDKEQLMKTRSLSMCGLRKKINQILVEKSKKNEIYHNVTFDPASHIADPDLAEAARLGKNALRDPKRLVMLMEKFDHNQNKVAAFLGVNRSSINRRLKAYKIEIYDHKENEDQLHENLVNQDELE